MAIRCELKTSPIPAGSVSRPAAEPAGSLKAIGDRRTAARAAKSLPKAISHSGMFR